MLGCLGQARPAQDTDVVARTVAAVALAALAVASAAYLIVALSDPYAGLFRVSSAPLDQVLAVMGKE